MKLKKKILFVALVILPMTFMALWIVHGVTSFFSWRKEIEDFESVPFLWDDDTDRYEIEVRGPNSVSWYYVPVSETILVYSEEDWTCFGCVVTGYNAWGREIEVGVKDFHINLWQGGERDA